MTYRFKKTARMNRFPDLVQFSDAGESRGRSYNLESNYGESGFRSKKLEDHYSGIILFANMT